MRVNFKISDLRLTFLKCIPVFKGVPLKIIILFTCEPHFQCIVNPKVVVTYLTVMKTATTRTRQRHKRINKEFLC